MTERDKKVLAIVSALVVLGGFWFLVIGKKRSAIAEAQKAQVAAQQALTDAKTKEASNKVLAKVKPASYAKLVRLGKAIPDTDDFQSLLVQVNDLTVDSNVSFVSLSTSTAAAGGATSAGATGQTSTCDAAGASAAAGASGASGASAPAPAPSPSTGITGSTAQTWVGKDRDKAKNAVKSADQSSSKDEHTTLDCDRSATLTDLSASAAGLTPINYSFDFQGSFFDLHEVYDRLLDLVRVHNAKVNVTGRLLDINSISMTVTDFPTLDAAVQMTGYRLPDDSAAVSTAAPAAAAASTATANGAASGGSAQ